MRNPSDKLAAISRGHAAAGGGDRDYARAIADFTEVVRLSPNWPSGFIKRGHAYLDAKDYDRALADHTAAIRLAPTLGPLYRNRANAYRAMDHTAHAAADLAKADRLDAGS